MDSAQPARTTKTCAECRRRKIRCDGNLPCNKCIYYEAPICQYNPRKRRKVAPRRPSTIANPEEPSVHSNADLVLKKLFPSYTPEVLAQLSRSQLLQLVNADHTSPLGNDSSGVLSAITQNDQYSEEEEANDIEEGDDERRWDESQDPQDPERAICDDVNGLSLTVNHRSYLGISSIHAVIRTMFRLNPSLQKELKTVVSNSGTQTPSLLNWTSASPSDHELLDATPLVDEDTSINAYFAHVHGIAPLLDEAEFRDTVKCGERRDRPWLALFNMVLVLGSLVTGDSDESARIYYARAKTYLDFELLGIGCIESLQALCLLGGLYLHYRNSPNLAHTIMGAAYRIAISLGLHRQPVIPGAFPSDTGPRAWKPQNRRRIWWSLFCLDTWGSTTLGRPTLGRWDPDTMNVPISNALEDPFTRSLDCFRAFCVIATRIQHRFAQFTPLNTDEMAKYDSELQTWYRNLPREFRQLEECPRRVVSAHRIIKNRYLNLRLLLYRPMLLRYANARVSLESLPATERAAIEKCQDIACEIVDWAASSFPHALTRLDAWSAVWYSYQASMVLILSILIDPEHNNNTKWRTCIERSLLLFDQAKPRSRAAGRSKQVILSLLNACNNVAARALENSPEKSDAASSMSPSIWAQLGLEMSSEDNWELGTTAWQADFGGDFEWYNTSFP